MSTTVMAFLLRTLLWLGLLYGGFFVVAVVYRIKTKGEMGGIASEPE